MVTIATMVYGSLNSDSPYVNILERDSNYTFDINRKLSYVVLEL